MLFAHRINQFTLESEYGGFELDSQFCTRTETTVKKLPKIREDLGFEGRLNGIPSWKDSFPGSLSVFEVHVRGIIFVREAICMEP